MGEKKYLTKVVTQFVQFLSNNRAATALEEQVSIVEDEDMEQPYSPVFELVIVCLAGSPVTKI